MTSLEAIPLTSPLWWYAISLCPAANTWFFSSRKSRLCKEPSPDGCLVRCVRWAAMARLASRVMDRMILSSGSGGNSREARPAGQSEPRREAAISSLHARLTNSRSVCRVTARSCLAWAIPRSRGRRGARCWCQSVRTQTLVRASSSWHSNSESLKSYLSYSKMVDTIFVL